MAKKKPQAGTDVRAKAQQMREEQKKREQRTRNIIIGVVAVLIITIIAAIVMIIVNRPKPTDALDALPAQFSDGQAILVSSGGVGAATSDTEGLDLYFDYTCAGCVALEAAIGEDLFGGVTSGDYDLLMHPVLTHAAAFNTPATAAALVVASEAPELFETLHQSMIMYYYDAMQTEDGSVVNNLSKSTEAVAQLAKDAGVPDDLIAKFDNDAAQAYLTLSTDAWVARDVEGRANVSSPELVYMGMTIDPVGADGAALYQSILDQMKEIAGG